MLGLEQIRANLSPPVAELPAVRLTRGSTVDNNLSKDEGPSPPPLHASTACVQARCVSHPHVFPTVIGRIDIHTRQAYKGLRPAYIS